MRDSEYTKRQAANGLLSLSQGLCSGKNAVVHYALYQTPYSAPPAGGETEAVPVCMARQRLHLRRVTSEIQKKFQKQ